MTRIGILTCSNCTQETNCASVVCLGDLRKRRGFFEQYPKDEPLDLIGIINCAGCPTLNAVDLRPRVSPFAVAAFGSTREFATWPGPGGSPGDFGQTTSEQLLALLQGFS